MRIKRDVFIVKVSGPVVVDGRGVFAHAHNQDRSISKFIKWERYLKDFMKGKRQRFVYATLENPNDPKSKLRLEMHAPWQRW